MGCPETRASQAAAGSCRAGEVQGSGWGDLCPSHDLRTGPGRGASSTPACLHALLSSLRSDHAGQPGDAEPGPAWPGTCSLGARSFKCMPAWRVTAQSPSGLGPAPVLQEHRMIPPCRDPAQSRGTWGNPHGKAAGAGVCGLIRSVICGVKARCLRLK